MTRQGDDPYAVLRGVQVNVGLDSGRVESSIKVTSADRMKELEDSKPNALCKLDVKKDLAMRFIGLKDSIEHDIMVVDPGSIFNFAEHVEEISAQWITKNKKKKMANKQHAEVLIKLMSVVYVLASEKEKLQDRLRVSIAKST
jgi:hypothetical protein